MAIKDEIKKYLYFKEFKNLEQILHMERWVKFDKGFSTGFTHNDDYAFRLHSKDDGYYLVMARFVNWEESIMAQVVIKNEETPILTYELILNTIKLFIDNYILKE